MKNTINELFALVFGINNLIKRKGNENIEFF